MSKKKSKRKYSYTERQAYYLRKALNSSIAYANVSRRKHGNEPLPYIKDSVKGENAQKFLNKYQNKINI